MSVINNEPNFRLTRILLQISKILKLNNARRSEEIVKYRKQMSYLLYIY